MCQMSIVLEKDGQSEKIMDNVNSLEVTEEGVTISTLFEAPKNIANVSIRNIDFSEGITTLVRN